jgi:hypothetical protein
LARYLQTNKQKKKKKKDHKKIKSEEVRRAQAIRGHKPSHSRKPT